LLQNEAVTLPPLASPDLDTKKARGLSPARLVAGNRSNHLRLAHRETFAQNRRHPVSRQRGDGSRNDCRACA